MVCNKGREGITGDNRAMIRKHLTFTGQVQGVGFRYRAHSIANELGLTGYVRNEYNGTVEAEVQGTAEAIAEYIRRLQNASYIRIEYIAEYDMPLQEETCYRIR